ncbi:MAG: glycosyltransferase family 9 protein [Phycisphaeraceae bacterium]|nr:glycosyltransferase family 9 protein [Bacteroidota bacterium]MCW5768129.1 glycosyltransferase family 9 protein [Phycisphaeraceae bacterium]
MLADIAANIAHLVRKAVSVSELEYMAFSGQYEVVHGIFQSIVKESRIQYANKYILHEVVVGGIKKLRAYLAVSAEIAANQEKAFISETVDLFIRNSQQTGSCPRELFETLLLWSDELTKLSLLHEALERYDQAIEMNVGKFPDLYVRCLVGKAGVLNTLGKFPETESLLASLARRPYRVTDRNMIPTLLFNLGQESLLRGNIEFYKSLMFQGLRHFYTDIKQRRQFVQQIRKTYRRSHNVFLDSSVSSSDKTLFLLHRVYFIAERFKTTRYIGIEQALRYCVLGYVYCVNYLLNRAASGGISPREGQQMPVSHVLRRSFLITRAMGGIGDFLMMTPGIHELKRKHREAEIHLAIPRRYFPVFQANPDVKLLDVEEEAFNHFVYKKWFNFTDCPASRLESRTAPKVRKNRIELFAGNLGLGRWTVRTMRKLPRYFVTEEEREFQKSFWASRGLEGKTVIGVQLHADEVYRDYPHMQQLVVQLSRHYHVLVFDIEPISGCDGPNITKVEGLPMRQAFALVSGCSAIVAPDSSFVHLSAAFNIPCVALYGPIDGKVRTMDYPNCRFIDVRAKLGCMPCWRNDKIPCKLTNMRTSVCMGDISIDEIITTVHNFTKEE